MTTTNANTSADLQLFKGWIKSLEQTLAEAEKLPVSEAIKTLEEAVKEIALVANAFGADNPHAVEMGRLAKAALDLTGAGKPDPYAALKEKIGTVASQMETQSPYWIDGGYNSDFWYCEECAETLLREFKVHPDLFYGAEIHPAHGAEVGELASCETCGCYLEASFFPALCETELTRLEGEFDPDSPLDCYILLQIIESAPDSLSNRIGALAQKILNGAG